MNPSSLYVHGIGRDPRGWSRASPARTFGFLKDVQRLQARGLALGGSPANAIVLDDSAVLNRDGLRFADEFARHKVLDLLGDLALLGVPLQGHVKAMRSGHGLHQALVAEIRANPACWTLEVPATAGVRVPVAGRRRVPRLSPVG